MALSRRAAQLLSEVQSRSQGQGPSWGPGHSSEAKADRLCPRACRDWNAGLAFPRRAAPRAGVAPGGEFAGPR